TGSDRRPMKATKARQHEGSIVPILLRAVVPSWLFLAATLGANQTAAPADEDAAALVGKYCVGCHNDRLKTCAPQKQRSVRCKSFTQPVPIGIRDAARPGSRLTKPGGPPEDDGRPSARKPAPM